MKATLTFDLFVPEDREAFALANRAGKLDSAVHEFREYLRALAKYDSKRVEKLAPGDLLEEIRTYFHDMFVEEA